MPNAIGPGEVCPRFGHYEILILVSALWGRMLVSGLASQRNPSHCCHSKYQFMVV